MKATELQKKDAKELEKLARDLKKKISEIKFRFSANKLKNTQEISIVKKDVARILTILNQKLNIKD